MYFTSGSDRAFEQLMQTRPGADHFDSGEAGAPEDCGTCRFYRPHWKYQFCVYEECPYQPGKLTALDGAVKFQVKGVDDEMAVFRVEKNRGYTVMSNHHLRNKDLSLKAKGLLSQMLSLPEDWDFTLKGLSLINREQIDAIRAAVRELEQAGYIVRSRERDSQGRLRGKGIRNLRSGTPGDLYIHVLTETPVNLSSKQKDLLRQFDASLKEGGEKHSPKTEGIFEQMKNFFKK